MTDRVLLFVSWLHSFSILSKIFVSYMVDTNLLCILSRMHSLLWTSLVAQMVKRLPTMQETWVQSLGWEDLLEKEMSTHSSILAWKIPWTEEPGTVHGIVKSWTQLNNFTHYF